MSSLYLLTRSIFFLTIYFGIYVEPVLGVYAFLPSFLIISIFACISLLLLLIYFFFSQHLRVAVAKDKNLNVGPFWWVNNTLDVLLGSLIVVILDFNNISFFDYIIYTGIFAATVNLFLFQRLIHWKRSET